ncbi:MAG: sugar phosphate isomerase/epimerase [Spirochaetaceae bacterium]|nr:sugar phosphate isomerase/epimerase [Spirochaetaceae bacterium]
MGRKRSSIGLWAYIWGAYAEVPVPQEKAVETVAGLGFDGIEVAAYEPYFCNNTSRNRRILRKLYDDNGLERSGLAAPFPSVITTCNGEYLDCIKSNLDICTDVGIPKLRVNSAESPERLPEGVDYKTAFTNAAKNWNSAAEECAKAGVSLVWEFEPGFLFNKPSEVITMVKHVDHPNFSLLFDICHGSMCAEKAARQMGEKEILPGGILEFIELCRGHIGHVHVSDSDGTLHDGETSTHAPFGAGQLDFDAIMPAFEEAGYEDDWWVIDLCFCPDALTVTAENKKFLDGLISEYGR